MGVGEGAYLNADQWSKQCCYTSGELPNREDSRDGEGWAAI